MALANSIIMTHLFALLRTHALELEVAVHYEQDVHELALVLVEPLRHDLVKRVLRDLKPVAMLFDPLLEPELVVVAHLHPLRLEVRVFCEWSQVHEHTHICKPLLLAAQPLREQVGERPVRRINPATRGNPVGLVDELAWEVGIEVREEILLEQLGMEGSHSIHLMTPNDREISHADLLGEALLYNAKL